MANTLILMTAGIMGATTTFLLHKYFVSIVVASCLVGLIGALLGQFFKLPHLTLVIFASSFVGMSNFLIGAIPSIILGGALSGAIYSFSTHLFIGFGGRLGAIAFISTTVSFCLMLIMNKFFYIVMKLLSNQT
jgi:hypothetical protein